MGPPAKMFLATPESGPWPDVTFKQVEDLRTRTAANDVGEIGKTTIDLTTIVEPLSEAVDEIAARANVTFSENTFGGTTHRAETNTRFETVKRSE